MIDRISSFILGTLLTMMVYPHTFQAGFGGILVGAIGFIILGILYKCLLDVLFYGEVKQ